MILYISTVKCILSENKQANEMVILRSVLITDLTVIK